MADDGSGNFSLPSAAFVSGTTATVAPVNANFSDIATALTARVTRNGSGSMSGNLAMGTYRVTGMGNGTARTDAASVAQVQDSAPLWGGTAAGTANARTVSLTPAITSYTAGRAIRFINGAAANAAGSMTLNVNSVGARTILLPDAATAPLAGMLPASALIEVVDDGTRFLLTRPSYDGGLVTLHSAAFSGAASVDINVLYAGYREFHFSGHIYPGTDAAAIYWRTSTDAGSNFDAGGSDYVYQAAGTNTATTLVAANTTAAFVTVGAGDAGAATSGVQISGVVFPGDGTRNPRLSALTTGAFDNGAGAFLGAIAVAGERASATRINAMRFIASSGTISGHLTVRGVI